MFDSIKTVLEFMDEWGADKVFLVWFFLLYLKSNRQKEKLQEARLCDNKKSLETLIEARHALEDAHDMDELRTNMVETRDYLGRIRGSIDKLEIKVDHVKEIIEKS